MEKKLPRVYQLNFRSLIIGFVLLTGIAFNSCRKENLPELIIPTRVGFNSRTYVIEKNVTDPFKIALLLPRPLEKAGTMVISILASSTADDSEYTTNPAAVDGKITLNLEKGDSTASFTVTSANNFLDDKTIALNISAATGGLSLGNPELKTTITLTGNRVILPPTITASVSSLADFGEVATGAESDAETYTISGSNLTGNVVITASENFKISLDNVVFSSALEVDGNDVDIPIYVKFTPTAGTEGVLTGTITHASENATDVVITVSGIETAPPPEVLLLDENFDYGATESDLVSISGGKWAPYSAGGTLAVKYIPSGLSFSGYGGSAIGGAATSQNGSGSREDITRTFSQQSTGVIYMAQLINISRSTSGDFFLSLRDNSGTFFNRLFAKDDGNGNLSLGVGKYTTVEYVPGLQYGTTYLVVIKYDFAAQVSSMYIIDGTIPTTEPTEASAVSSIGNAPTNLSDVVIRQATGVLDASIDGIRIGVTWKSVLGL